MLLYAISACLTIRDKNGTYSKQVPSFILGNVLNREQAESLARHILLVGASDEVIEVNVCAMPWREIS